MAPLPTTSQHMTSLSKRNFEAETWRAILGAIGAFILLGLIGILAGWWRHKSIKKQSELRASAQRGSYGKIDEDRNSLDYLEGSNGIRVLRLQRTNSTSSSSSSDSESERRSRRDQLLLAKLNHPRSHSLCALPVATPRGRTNIPYVNAEGRSFGPQSIAKSFTPLRQVPSTAPQILSPPRAAYVDAGVGIYDSHKIPRSSSPAPLVLTRSVSMLRPSRSISLDR